MHHLGQVIQQNRTRPDSGKSSNVYTLYDFKELWEAGSSEEVVTVGTLFWFLKVAEFLKVYIQKISKYQEH